MSELTQSVQSFAKKLNELKFHILVGFFSIFVFVFLLFPFDDLTDLASSQIAAATQNRVFTQFEGLDVSLFPTISAEATKAHIEIAGVPLPIKAEFVRVWPSVFAAIRQRAEGHLRMEGFYNGNIDIRLRDGGVSDRGSQRQNVVFDTEGIQIGSLIEAAKLSLPLDIKGLLTLKSSGVIDMGFTEEPQFDADIGLASFQSLPFSLDMQGMGLSVPGLKLSEVSIKAKLNAGRLELEQVRLGKAGDDLQMTVKGTMVLQMTQGQQRPHIGQYSFDIDLTPSASFLRGGGADFLTILGSLMGRMSDNPGRMRFNVSGNGPHEQARFRPL